MFVVDAEVEIERPVPEVFDFVADMTNAPRWQSGLHLVQRIPPGPVKVGSEHVFERRFAGRTLTSRNRITELHRPRRIAFEIPDGWLSGTAAYEVTPTEGGSRIACRMEFRARGLGRLAEPLLARVLRHDSHRDDQLLKAVLEGRPAVTNTTPGGQIEARSARAAAIVTWVYALGFGLPTVPVAVHLLRTGRLPSFFGLFDMFAGPWSARVPDSTFVALLLAFGAATLVAAYSAWLLRRRRRIGAVLNLAVLPVEAVFWIGFALPLPWVTGLARVVLVAAAWNSLSKSEHQTELAPSR